MKLPRVTLPGMQRWSQSRLRAADLPRTPTASVPASAKFASTIDRALRKAGLLHAEAPPGDLHPKPAKPFPDRPDDGNSDTAAGFTSGSHRSRHGTLDYKIYLPKSRSREPRPLLVMLHGCTQDADDFATGTRMNALAEQAGAVVVYPVQPPRANGARCWNWFRPEDQRRAGGEPAQIAALATHLTATAAVDPNRVYAAGLSAGGAMAAILGREFPDLFAAVGVHSGLAPGAARDVGSAFAAMKSGPAALAPAARRGAAPALIVFHGDGDSTVHPANADAVVAAFVPPHARRQIAARTAGFTRENFAHAGAPAEQWTIHGAGHAWSGGSPQGSYTHPSGPDASREMLRFFFENPRTNRD